MFIDRDAYSDPTILAEEIKRLFGIRAFAGLASEFASVDDYKSFILGNRAITLRKTAGGVRAFNNVCLHRNALIDPLGKGGRPFRCGYHGWSYGDDGELKHTPMMTIQEACERQLVEYPVAQAEGICFVGTTHTPDVSGVRLALDAAELVVATPFHQESLDHACNWKLLVENVVEVQHLSHVHTDSFIPAGFTSSATYKSGINGTASWAKLTPTAQHDRSRAIKRINVQARHHYSHVFFFPDLFLSNTNGLVGYLGHVVPTGPASTRLNWSLFELPALAALRTSVREQVQADAIMFSRTALLEDRAILHSCQLGLMSKGVTPQLQSVETRVLDFHRLYMEKMADA